MNIDKITDISITLGSLVVENGGETYRAEETMQKTALALGASSVGMFAMRTGAFLSCEDERSMTSATRIKRIANHSINLLRLSRLKHLTDGIIAQPEQYTQARLQEEIEAINALPRYKSASFALITAITAFFFAFLFDGSMTEAIVSFFVSLAMRIVLSAIKGLSPSQFMEAILGSFIISLGSTIAVMLGILESVAIVNVSVLMALLPGLAFVNAIRDIIAGDYASGGSRGLEALIVAAGLAVGASICLILFPEPNMARADYSLALNIPFSVFCSCMIAFFFAMVFQSRNIKLLCITAICGGAGWFAYMLLLSYGVNVLLCYAVGALGIGIASEIAADIVHEPALVFLLPSTIAFVPGYGMYETMYAVAHNLASDALIIGINTVAISGAFAVGIAISSSLAGFARKLSSSTRRNSKTDKTQF